MKKKMFHTQAERRGDYEIRYVAGEDFVEMGSIAGEQYLAAIYFCKMYEKSYSPYIFPSHMKFIKESLNNFLDKYNLDIKQEYPSFMDIVGVEIYRQFYHGDAKYSSLVLTVFNDYRKVWLRIEEISHQNFYPEYHMTFLVDAKTMLYVLKKYEKLSKEYRVKSFYRQLLENDVRG